jgi:tryptophan 7-halogenase
VFLDASWIAVYLGQGIVPAGWDPRADAADGAALRDGVEQLRAAIAADVAGRPDHRGFIDRYCPMREAA